MVVDRDSELAARAAKGDPEATRLLVEGSWDTVCRYAMRMGASASEAEDLAQDVFLRAFRSLGSFSPGTNLKAWLLRIATNRLVDEARRRGSWLEARQVGEGLRAAARQEGPDHTAERRELERAVSDAVEGLPPEERAVLVLRVHEGLPHREIASVVGKTEPTVRWHLHQARRRLRGALSGFLQD